MIAQASLVALVLGAAAAFAAWRTWRLLARVRAWRVVGQFVVALLLYLVLFPPSTRELFTSGEMTVLTPGLGKSQVDAIPRTGTVVALPGVVGSGSIERVPDLGTAMRRHPDSRRIIVVGGGLPTRDRDAARGLVARFDAAPLPRGIVELTIPHDVRAGGRFRIDGQVEDVQGGRIELCDPAATIIATSALGDDGRFSVRGVAKVAGNALYSLRVMDAAGNRVDEIALPIAARAGDALKLLVLAGAPDAELKYLRRWAVDAGVALDSRITLSTGVALTEGTAPASAQALDAAALGALDVVVIDGRAWSGLDAASKAALGSAVRGGLGLMLRLTGPVDASVVSDFAGFGFDLHPGDGASVPVSVARTLGLGEGAPDLSRSGTGVSAPDAAVLLHDDAGHPLALWRVVGRGRVAVWSLADSFRLALAGDTAAFGSLWSDTFATVARARSTAVPHLPDDARVGERASICGVAADATVNDDAKQRTRLLRVPSATRQRCAAYWPLRPGWHSLASSGAGATFFVRDIDAAPALERGERMRATQALLTGSIDTDAAARSVRRTPLPRWPFFIAWLIAIAVLWIVERRRSTVATTSSALAT